MLRKWDETKNWVVAATIILPRHGTTAAQRNSESFLILWTFTSSALEGGVKWDKLHPHASFH